MPKPGHRSFQLTPRPYLMGKRCIRRVSILYATVNTLSLLAAFATFATLTFAIVRFNLLDDRYKIESIVRPSCVALGVVERLSRHKHLRFDSVSWQCDGHECSSYRMDASMARRLFFYVTLSKARLGGARRRHCLNGSDKFLPETQGIQFGKQAGLERIRQAAYRFFAGASKRLWHDQNCVYGREDA